MKKRVYLIAAVVSGALAVSGCTTNPYTGEREAGKSAIGAGLGSLVGAGIGALSSSKKDRGKGALIGAAAGAAAIASGQGGRRHRGRADGRAHYKAFLQYWRYRTGISDYYDASR